MGALMMYGMLWVLAIGAVIYFRHQDKKHKD